MRTTVDLPEDLHRAARSLAHDRGTSLSKTLADLVRGGLCPEGPGERVSVDQNTGLPVVHLGTTVTTDTVRALLDEE